ncbi:MAG: glutathione S-transferase protein [Rhodospirillales bacterium]|nr:glutathione S-transferase protein [Rhodospirillales bacterium]
MPAGETVEREDALAGLPELVLFHAAHSTCSQKVRLCLAEKNLAYTSRILAIRRNEHLDPAYLAINPNGVIPTLTVNGESVIDSSVICEYLDEVYPLPNLSPPDAMGRARMRAWLRYLEEVPTAAIRIPSINALFVGLMNELGEGWEDVRRRTPLRGELYAKVGPQGFGRAETEASLQRLRATLDRVDAALQNGPWLLGPSFSLADIVLAPTLVRMEDLGLDAMWSDLPRVASWLRRLAERPSFAIAYFPGSRVTVATTDQLI